MVFIWWRGYGYLVPVIGVAGYAFSHLLTDALGFPEYPSAMAVSVLVGFVLWRTGRRLNDPQRDRVLVDPATGETVRLVEHHDLLCIKMEYWCIATALVWVGLLLGWLWPWLVE